MSARILIVDDIETNLDILELKLQRYQFEVLRAENGFDALTFAEKWQPDLIILDVMMPGIDGFATCQQLKLLEKTAHIPVLMLTALTDKKDRLKGLLAGADDFLSKPVDDQALLSRARALIRLKRTADEWHLRAKILGSLGADQNFKIEDVDPRHPTLFVFLKNKAELSNLREATSKDDAIWLEVNELEDIIEVRKKGLGDLIIFDFDFNQNVPFELCQNLRQEECLRGIPILGIAEEASHDMIQKALEHGLNDYLLRPIDAHEAYLRIRGQVRRWRYHQKLLEDALNITLYDRAFALRHIKELMERDSSAQKVFSILYFVLGAQPSDELKYAIVKAIQRDLRSFDLVCTFGDDKLLAILPETELEIAQKIVHRVKAKLVPLLGHQYPLFVGASCFDGKDKAPQDLLLRAGG